MTEPRAPSTYARAESGARQFVIQLGLGMVAFIGGTMLSSGVAARFAERVGPVSNELVGTVLQVFFERLWLFVAAPFFGYLVGRFSEQRAVGFALTSVLAGETFSVLLLSAINGIDSLLLDSRGLVVRGVTLLVGLLLTHRLVLVGRSAAAEAQAEADAEATARKAEYAAYLAASPQPDPPPQEGAGAGGATPGAGPSS